MHCCHQDDDAKCMVTKQITWKILLNWSIVTRFSTFQDNHGQMHTEDLRIMDVLLSISLRVNFEHCDIQTTSPASSPEALPFTD